MINQKGISKLVSTPIVTLHDNKNTQFDVVNNIAYSVGEAIVNNETTKATKSFKYKDVGLKINIKPTIYDSETVYLEFEMNVDNVINDAELTGSVNTIFLDGDKNVIGENTDVYGLQAAYLKAIDNNLNKKVLVIGAGGVSPSVILSVKKSRINNIAITNRTNEKCIFLKKKFKFLNIIPWEKLKLEVQNFDIIINATSLGLKNGEDFNFNFTKTKNELI